MSMRNTGPVPDDRAFARRMIEVRDDLVRDSRQRHAGLLERPLQERLWDLPQEPPRAVVHGALAELCCRSRLEDGRLVVEAYADEAPGLLPEERGTLRGWTRLPPQPLFLEIEGAEGGLLAVRDVQGGERLRLFVAEMGVEFRPGALVYATPVPVRDFYLPIGTAQGVPEELRRTLARKMDRPELAPLPRARYIPPEDGPAPAPDSPCPCGSGKRFRKCCRRR